MNFTPNEITLMRNYKEAQELIEQQAAVIEQMRDLLDDCVNSLANYKFLQKRSHDPIGAEVTAKEIASIKEALALQPCPEVLNKVRAEAVRNFAVEMERANAELPLQFAYWYADRIEKGEA